MSVDKDSYWTTKNAGSFQCLLTKTAIGPRRMPGHSSVCWQGQLLDDEECRVILVSVNKDSYWTTKNAGSFQCLLIRTAIGRRRMPGHSSVCWQGQLLDHEECRVIPVFVDKDSYWIPTILYSDQGANYTSSTIHRLCNSMGFKKCCTSLYHPHNEPGSESLDRTMLNILETLDT